MIHYLFSFPKFLPYNGQGLKNTLQYTKNTLKYEKHTAWKISKYGVFLARIFPHSDWIRRGTQYLSIFSPNLGKYGPEKTPYSETFHAVTENLKKQITLYLLLLWDSFLHWEKSSSLTFHLVMVWREVWDLPFLIRCPQ